MGNAHSRTGSQARGGKGKESQTSETWYVLRRCATVFMPEDFLTPLFIFACFISREETQGGSWKGSLASLALGRRGGYDRRPRVTGIGCLHQLIASLSITIKMHASHVCRKSPEGNLFISWHATHHTTSQHTQIAPLSLSENKHNNYFSPLSVNEHNTRNTAFYERWIYCRLLRAQSSRVPP